MMLKTNSGYIPVGDVEVERQVKLFQNIADSAGDFSYSFEIDANTENLDKLGIISPVDGFQKSVFTIFDISLCDDYGAIVYTGYVRVTKITDVIEASFFSGNNNWFSIMSGNMEDLDLSAYEKSIDVTTIPASWSLTSGVVFPLVDLGTIGQRSTNNWKLDEFKPFIYIKDVVDECFDQSGLKLAGDILLDERYQKMITTNNRSQNQDSESLRERKTFVHKSVSQSATTSFTVVTFPVITSPFYYGSRWDTINNKYVADVRMTVKINLAAIATVSAAVGNFLVIRLYKNGAFFRDMAFLGTGTGQSVSANLTVTIENGDEIDVRMQRSAAGTASIDSGGLIISPVRLFIVRPANILPKSTQVEFVNNVFKLFNTVIDYDPITKKVTVDFFKNVIQREEIDLSEYIDPETIQIDYQELINEFGRQNILKYTDPSSEEIEVFNSDKTITYGAGEITSENSFVETSKVILESIFAASTMSPDNPIGALLPRMDFVEAEEGLDFEVTITNSGGALITIDANSGIEENDIINIKQSSFVDYNGQYLVSTFVTGTTFRVVGLTYDSNATAKVTKVTFNQQDNEDQIILIAEPQVPLSEFSQESYIDIEEPGSAAALDPMYAWFYKPEQGMTVDDLTKSLSFGDVAIQNAYQRTLIPDYWNDLERILQDPVKVYVDAYLPKTVFDSITFKQPLRIKCDKFNAKFFPNRITGYKDSSQPCTLELIKLP